MDKGRHGQVEIIVALLLALDYVCAMHKLTAVNTCEILFCLFYI